MAKRFLLLFLVLVAFVAAGSYAYSRYRADRRLNGGEVLTGDNGRVVTEDGTAPVKTPTHSETPDSPETRTQAKPSANGAPTPAAAFQPASSAPATDTLAPDAPNRAAFRGSGRFQVYRQGDLTWRVNTDTGNTCVLFATLNEWRKPLVYRNACSPR